MEKKFCPEGVILLQLGIFEVFHYKSELQPGVLIVFCLFDRPVSKSFHRVFLFQGFSFSGFFIFPLFQDLTRGLFFAKIRFTLLDKKSKSYQIYRVI